MHDNETLMKKGSGRARAVTSLSQTRNAPSVRSYRIACHPAVLHRQDLEAPRLHSFTTRGSRREGFLSTHGKVEIVHLIAKGCTNKQIAIALDISLKTVETHRATVMRKLKLSSAASLSSATQSAISSRSYEGTQMPLSRGRGLPPLTQIDGVHFALLDRSRIVRCAVTRGALAHLAKHPLAIDQQEFIFSAHRDAMRASQAASTMPGKKHMAGS